MYAGRSAYITVEEGIAGLTYGDSVIAEHYFEHSPDGW